MFENYIIYEIVKFGKGIEKVSTSYKDLLENFYETKIKCVNLMRHPVYVEDLKLLKKPKVIQKEIESFKNVLSEDTKVTYLKLYRTILILQVDVEEEVLQKELIKIININRLRTYAT